MAFHGENKNFPTFQHTARNMLKYLIYEASKRDIPGVKNRSRYGREKDSIYTASSLFARDRSFLLAVLG